jgi:integrase/recombinase XerD
VKAQPPDGIVQKDVVSFMVRLASEGMATPSVARHLSAVRGFHKYLLIDGLATTDPTANVETPRGWKRLPKTLSAADVETLLAQPQGATPIGLRDRAMLELLYVKACG